jgi:glycosyltransferase involved in cell wall biosynthesis
MESNSYSIVIATSDRPGPLDLALSSIADQQECPSQVVVVDSSPNTLSEEVCRKFRDRLTLTYMRSEARSAAKQRNIGARSVTTPLILFCDDDVVLPPDVLGKLKSVFASRPDVGGVAGRIANFAHPPPRGLLRWYYRLQAGYDHPNYGAKLFGPGINCLPCHLASDPELIESDWLNSTCTMYGRALFERERFPEFDGYSAFEDVHLSARIARTHRLFFHNTAIYEHRSQSSDLKRDIFALTRMSTRNRLVVAREVMRVPTFTLLWKDFVHRLFLSVVALRSRYKGWKQAILALWTS